MPLYIPTKMKITGARLIYKFLSNFLPEEIKVTRAGVRYDLDLREGIDLSIFLTGGFQSYINTSRHISLENCGYILDVGANIGSMSLSFAKRFPCAKVIAFEPTHYGIGKLRRNLELNPALSARIEPVQLLLSDGTTPGSEIRAYASWKVDSVSEGNDVHPVHLGRVMSTEGVEATTLDVFCKERGLRGIGLVKIDTDGHEHRVLAGSRETIASNRPFVVFEIGRYVMEEAGIDFDWYLNYFGEYRYKLADIRTGREITGLNWKKSIPEFGTIDLLAMP